jgi:hypothetical protein
MAIDEAMLRARALRAYERGRFESALRTSSLALPLIALSWLACRNLAGTLVSGGALFSLCVFARWRGGALARGVAPGLLAGVMPLLGPIVTLGLHSCSDGTCCSTFLFACFAGGLAGGALAGAWLSRREPLELPAVAAALSIAALTGALGCLIAGVGGVVGMGLGLLAGSVPAIWLARARGA